MLTFEIASGTGLSSGICALTIYRKKAVQRGRGFRVCGQPETFLALELALKIRKRCALCHAILLNSLTLVVGVSMHPQK